MKNIFLFFELQKKKKQKKWTKINGIKKQKWTALHQLQCSLQKSSTGATQLFVSIAHTKI